MTDKIGDRFHQLTKYHRDKMEWGEIDWNNKPLTYKYYKDKTKIELSPPNKLSNITLHNAIKERISTRSFSKTPISKEQLSYLLWSSTGIKRKEFDFEYRTVPSAGALYPIETYLVVNNVKDLAKGVYHYDIKNHQLECLKSGDFGLKISKAALDQEMCLEAGVVFIWSALFSRSKWKYGERAYRYIYLDAGHIAQNLALSSASLKLGCCHIAAFYDDEINAIVDIDGISESAIYSSVVGCLD